MTRWPWWREARPIEPRRTASPKALELQTAKEILAEVFDARPADVEEMIRIGWRKELAGRKAMACHVLLHWERGGSRIPRPSGRG